MKEKFEGLVQNLRERDGFTLIELLVVVAIIGILSSVVLASLGGAREGARDSRRQSDMDQLQTALELYANENGSYDLSEQGASSTDQSALSPDHIQTVPTDPSTDEEYPVKTSQDGYCISAPEYEATPLPANNTDCSDASSTYSIGPGT